jgi:hypothetical protein
LLFCILLAAATGAKRKEKEKRKLYKAMGIWLGQYVIASNLE